MSIVKGQWKQKTGLGANNVLYPTTSVDQVVGLPDPETTDYGKYLGVDSTGAFTLLTYVPPAPVTSLSGIWSFIESRQMVLPEETITQNISFSLLDNPNMTYSSMTATPTELRYDNTVVYTAANGWVVLRNESKYQQIYFGEQSIVVGESFYDWFTISAAHESVWHYINATIVNGTKSGATYVSEYFDVTITITPDSGYELPSTITVTGASYVYNSTTGVVTLTQPTGVVSVSAECEDAPSSFSVAITLNETAINLRDYFRIYDGQNTSGTLLYEKTGTSGYVGTQTVTCTSGYLYFTAHSNSGGYAANFGGGFSNLVNVVAIGAYEAYAQAQVLGNGSATLSLEYDG